ncbi:MAG: YedE-related selenium metabolism membrane protein [Candidatus Coatesbacteria bacterium]|nr:YedE-related selenium metabolism membrane protein [Candidatus Coatesbacteria bacterium]
MLSFFSTRKGIIVAGILIGFFASFLQKMGNPPNMGICVACMERDIAGALGLHRAAVVQYMRPEIIGFVLGAFIAALIFKEFKSRTGSAPIIRFMLGFFAMIGSLVFLGCPWRMLLRLAGGDGNAILGALGLIAGVWIGVLFIKKGFSLGRSQKTYSIVGLIMPVIMISFLLLLLFKPQLPSGALFFSTEGPGSKYASIALSLGIAIIIGFIAQRTRFCTMGSIRDVILIKDFHLISGIIAMLISAFIANLVFNQFKPGFAEQPIAHTNHIWNFGGMLLAGLAFALAGGCPGRQLFMSGEGNGDASIFVLGMIGGAAFSHNFAIASTPKGVDLWGPGAVIIGIIFCLVIGFTMREK